MYREALMGPISHRPRLGHPAPTLCLESCVHTLQWLLLHTFSETLVAEKLFLK